MAAGGGEVVAKQFAERQHPPVLGPDGGTVARGHEVHRLVTVSVQNVDEHFNEARIGGGWSARAERREVRLDDYAERRGVTAGLGAPRRQHPPEAARVEHALKQLRGGSLRIVGDRDADVIIQSAAPSGRGVGQAAVLALRRSFARLRRARADGLAAGVFRAAVLAGADSPPAARVTCDMKPRYALPSLIESCA